MVGTEKSISSRAGVGLLYKLTAGSQRLRDRAGTNFQKGLDEGWLNGEPYGHRLG